MRGCEVIKKLRTPLAGNKWKNNFFSGVRGRSPRKKPHTPHTESAGYYYKVTNIKGFISYNKTMEHGAVQNLIEKSNRITILTGAGISTESGIPDFRSPGGVWDTYKTVTIQEFLSDPEKRKYYWQYKMATIPAMLETKPNPAHYAIGKLDDCGKLYWLLTQNIDGLHEQGGVDSKRIVNLHGTNREAVCLSCGKIYDINLILKRVESGEEIPLCDDCSGLLKPNTVSFGQNLNVKHLEIADRASRECDLFMAFGSSLQVTPACTFVEVAHRSGRPVVIINRDETPYDSIATYIIHDSLAAVLPQIFK